MRGLFDGIPGHLPVKAIARAIVERADALGLLWHLRPATVAKPGADGSMRAVLDGDTTPIRVVSMIGSVPVNSRVMVLVTPPAGNHIVGWVGATKPNEARIAPTLLNGWVNYGDAYLRAGYWKDSNGVGHMTGLIRDGVITNGTTLFQLQPGYLPSNREVHIVYGGAGPVRLDIMQTGDVQINSTTASAGYLSLAGVTWKCER